MLNFMDLARSGDQVKGILVLLLLSALPHQESDFAFVTKYHFSESFGIFNQAPTSRTALRQKDRKHRESFQEVDSS